MASDKQHSNNSNYNRTCVSCMIRRKYYVDTIVLFGSLVLFLGVAGSASSKI